MVAEKNEMKYLLYSLMLFAVGGQIVAEDHPVEVRVPHEADWWFDLTVSNLHKSASCPIKSNAVHFEIIIGQGMHPMNPWIIQRPAVETYRLDPSVITLQSDAAVDFLCNAPGVTLEEANKVWPEATWFMAFCQSNNRVIGFRAISEQTFLMLPDVDKALDNGQKLLRESRRSLFKKFKAKESAYQSIQPAPR